MRNYNLRVPLSGVVIEKKATQFYFNFYGEKKNISTARESVLTVRGIFLIFDSKRKYLNGEGIRFDNEGIFF